EIGNGTRGKSGGDGHDVDGDGEAASRPGAAERESTGGGAYRGYPGGKEDFRIDSVVPPPGANSSRCFYRGGGYRSANRSCCTDQSGNGRRNGGDDSRQCGSTHAVRHVQSCRKGDFDWSGSLAGEERRKERALGAGKRGPLRCL